MTKFKVTVRRIVVTVIEVDAETPSSAINQVKEYGAIEAVSDFPVLEEAMSATVKAAEPVNMED